MINTMTEENTIVKLPFANGNHPRTEAQKQVIIDQASAAYEVYMDALGFDWRSDPNSADTPMRVAKAFVNDLAVGCYDKPPKITAFDNIDNYDGLVFQGNITMHSFCSHPTVYWIRACRVYPRPRR